MPARPQIAPTADWRQIELLARAPGQRTDALMRPVVVFGQSATERAAETGAAEPPRYRRVARCDQLGLASLVPPPTVEQHRLRPVELRQAIRAAKPEQPPLTGHELTTICWARGGHRPSSHTFKRILAERPPDPGPTGASRPTTPPPTQVSIAWRSCAGTSRGGTPHPTWRI